jgi:hypothetical protein
MGKLTATLVVSATTPAMTTATAMTTTAATAGAIVVVVCVWSTHLGQVIRHAITPDLLQLLLVLAQVLLRPVTLLLIVGFLEVCTILVDLGHGITNLFAVTIPAPLTTAVLASTTLDDSQYNHGR